MNLIVDKYLKRIGITRRKEPDLPFLAELQEAHLRNVPYENCEIFFQKRPPSLEIEALYEKIVNQHRGGYCFELNGAFAWLLEQLGFQFIQTFARWCFGEKESLPPRRHRVLLVRFGQETWIADVGIGSPCPLTPLKLEYDTEQKRNGLCFRVIRDPAHGNLVQKLTEDGYRNYFSFWETPHFDQDFLYVNYFCSMEKNSFFRNNLCVNIPSLNGRRSIFMDSDDPQHRNFLFRRENLDGETDIIRISMEDHERLSGVLKKYFQIVLTANTPVKSVFGEKVSPLHAGD